MVVKGSRRVGSGKAVERLPGVLTWAERGILGWSALDWAGAVVCVEIAGCVQRGEGWDGCVGRFV